MRKYEFISDPGHGWLKVPANELLLLGIGHCISSCSYVDYSGKYVYLEEDCDFAVFAKAKGWTPETFHDHIFEQFQDPCSVRDMQPFLGWTA